METIVDLQLGTQLCMYIRICFCIVSQNTCQSCIWNIRSLGILKITLLPVLIVLHCFKNFWAIEFHSNQWSCEVFWWCLSVRHNLVRAEITPPLYWCCRIQVSHGTAIIRSSLNVLKQLLLYFVNVECFYSFSYSIFFTCWSFRRQLWFGRVVFSIWR